MLILIIAILLHHHPIPLNLLTLINTRSVSPNLPILCHQSYKQRRLFSLPSFVHREETDKGNALLIEHGGSALKSKLTSYEFT